jgi:hypothetical protein
MSDVYLVVVFVMMCVQCCALAAPSFITSLDLDAVKRHSQYHANAQLIVNTQVQSQEQM